MTDAMLALVMAEAKPAINPADPLEDRVRAAMKACYQHWMVTDEDTQFKGAIAAVFVATDNEDEKERIRAELESLRNLSALLDGVPIDLDAIQPLDNPVGLRRLWLETTGR